MHRAYTVHQPTIDAGSKNSSDSGGQADITESLTGMQYRNTGTHVSD